MPSNIRNSILDQFIDCVFKPYFLEFIKLKRGKGEKVTNSSLYVLKTINNRLSIFDSPYITKKMADYVLVQKKLEDGYLNDNIVSSFRQFTFFMSMFFANTYIVSDKYLPIERHQFRPFIFTSKELDAIIREVDEMADHHKKMSRLGFSPNPIPPHPFIVRFLVGTGMRIGEVVSLKVEDIDLSNNVARVIHGKNDVSRFIPMSPSLSECIRFYMSKITWKDSKSLFRSPYTGGGYSYENMRWLFDKLFKRASIKPRDGRKPTIHSFRHTFCTRCLQRMMDSGLDFYAALPILSAYVGHVNTIDTEKYIHMANSSFDKILIQEKPLSALIPKVVDYEE